MKNKPFYTTIVRPDDYDIVTDMEDMVYFSNSRKEIYTLMDVGKVVGLYLDWVELKKKLCNNEMDYIDKIME